MLKKYIVDKMNKALYIVPIILLMIGSASAFSVAFTGTGVAFINSNATTLQAGFVGQPVWVIGNGGDNYQLNYTDFNHQNENINTFSLANSTQQVSSGLLGSTGIYTLIDQSRWHNVTVSNTVVKVYENASFALINMGSLPANALQNDSPPVNTLALTSNIIANVITLNSQTANSVANSITNINANVLSIQNSLSSFEANVLLQVNKSIGIEQANLTKTNLFIANSIDGLTAEVPANTASQLANIRTNMSGIVTATNNDINSLSNAELQFFGLSIFIAVIVAVLLVMFVLPRPAAPEPAYYPPQQPYQPPAPKKAGFFGKKKRPPQQEQQQYYPQQPQNRPPPKYEDDAP